jgi:hypothetical protein
MGVGGLSALHGIAGPELRLMLDGGVPGQATLDRLAAILGWWPEDLHVVASVPMPVDRTPLDPEAGKRVYGLVDEAMRLSLAGRSELRQFAQSLPQQPRTGDSPVVPEWKQYPPGFGAVMAGFLTNRNLDWRPAVYVLDRVSRLCLSAVTIGSIGRGKKKLTAGELAEFAMLLGITAGDLAALAGVELPAERELPDPAATEIPGLIWDARRLTAAQVQQVTDLARSLERRI